MGELAEGILEQRHAGDPLATQERLLEVIFGVEQVRLLVVHVVVEMDRVVRELEVIPVSPPRLGRIPWRLQLERRRGWRRCRHRLGRRCVRLRPCGIPAGPSQRGQPEHKHTTHRPRAPNPGGWRGPCVVGEESVKRRKESRGYCGAGRACNLKALIFRDITIVHRCLSPTAAGCSSRPTPRHTAAVSPRTRRYRRQTARFVPWRPLPWRPSAAQRHFSRP